MLGVSLVVFAVVNILPGDPALTILGIDSTEDSREALRRELGLNAPVWERYLQWITGVVQGDFGTSYAFKVPVSTLIAERLPLTLALGLAASVITILLAISLGSIAAINHRRPGDWAVMVLSQMGIAIPVFWLSMLLVLVFAVNLRVLPPGGFPGWDEPWAAAKALVLPTVSIALVQSAVLTRVTRSSILEVMDLDFVRTARSLGYSRSRILLRHILPNALVPIITVFGLQLAGIVTGTIVIENVFYLPGLGRLVFQSISNRDLYTVQALVLLFTTIIVVTNFLVDVLYQVIDPRLRDGKR